MTHSTNSIKDESTTTASGHLVLVRHAESEWNLLGKWTGRTDVHLTEKGQREAKQLGEILRDIELNHAYTSEQIRTVETFLGLSQTATEKELSHERQAALNERDYGEYTGMNKWEVLEQVGEDTFTGIRRGWDHPIPGGETLEMVYKRAVPFYQETILPKLLAGQNVLIVSHGNTIRSLIKYLEQIDDAGIADVEMNFGEILIYRVDSNGHSTHKETRKIDTTPPHA
jgi:2,3-bisphosphoglycerate-dependent phosphoglycerate mutase